MTQTITIHTNTETDEYTVTAPGFDAFSTDDEVEARDEAESMAIELESQGCIVDIVRI